MSKHIPNPIIVNSNPDHECASTITVDDFTLRDLFVAAVLTGIHANSSVDMMHDFAAKYAFEAADSMLAERAKS